VYGGPAKAASAKPHNTMTAASRGKYCRTFVDHRRGVSKLVSLETRRGKDAAASAHQEVSHPSRNLHSRLLM